MKRARLILLCLGLGYFAFAAAATQLTCAICGMPLEARAKTSFESTRNGKPVAFCSFACAMRFHRESPKTPLRAYDFETGKAIDALDAYFLVKAKGALKDLGETMPPVVPAFATEADAQKKQKELHEGHVVHGLDAAGKVYE